MGNKLNNKEFSFKSYDFVDLTNFPIRAKIVKKKN